MEWIQSINNAIEYMEAQRAFNLLTGMTIGEYMRKRKLSLAGEELTKEGTKVIDVAIKYRYESPESFQRHFSIS